MKLNRVSQTELDVLGYIKGRVEGCIICGTPTPFIEICSEAHFCSTECEQKFYESINRVQRAR